MLRVFKNFLSGTTLYNFSVLHDRKVIGDGLYDPQIVGDEEVGHVEFFLNGF